MEQHRPAPAQAPAAELHGARAVVEAATTIHGTAGDVEGPVHVAVLKLAGQRVFAKLDREAHIDESPEAVLAGQKVKLLVKDDGAHYFQLDRGRGFDLGGLVTRVRGRMRAARDDDGAAEAAG